MKLIEGKRLLGVELGFSQVRTPTIIGSLEFGSSPLTVEDLEL
jgi:hypothetical protein